MLCQRLVGGLADVLLRCAQGAGLGGFTHGHTLGTHKAHIRHAEKAQHGLQVAFLVFHGAAAFAGGIDAATARHDDHGLALGQALRAVGRVLEGAAGLGDAVDPGLELRGDAEVVERRTNHHHVGGKELAHQLLGHSVLAHLHLAQALGLPGARGHGFHGEVGRGVGHQVQVIHLCAGVGGGPGGHHLCGELAGYRVGTGDGGIDVKQLHGDLLGVEPRCVAMDRLWRSP